MLHSQSAERLSWCIKLSGSDIQTSYQSVTHAYIMLNDIDGCCESNSFPTCNICHLVSLQCHLCVASPQSRVLLLISALTSLSTPAFISSISSHLTSCCVTSFRLNWVRSDWSQPRRTASLHSVWRSSSRLRPKWGSVMSNKMRWSDMRWAIWTLLTTRDRSSDICLCNQGY